MSSKQLKKSSTLPVEQAENPENTQVNLCTSKNFLFMDTSNENCHKELNKSEISPFGKGFSSDEKDLKVKSKSFNAEEILVNSNSEVFSDKDAISLNSISVAANINQEI